MLAPSVMVLYLLGEEEAHGGRACRAAVVVRQQFDLRNVAAHQYVFPC